MKHKWLVLLAVVGLLLALPTSAAPQTFVKHTIKPFWEGVRSVYAADMDGDGDVDVLAGAGHPSHGLSWWENDGDENFTEHPIAALDDAHSVQATDVDGDGDLDVVALGSGWDDGGAHWWENDGDGNFTWHEILWYYGPQNAYATDMDGDGDADVLMTTGADHKIYLLENRLGEPTPWVFYQITGPPPPCSPPNYEGCFLGAQTVYAADLDGDGDVDFVAGAEPYTHGISWWERGIGGWTEHFVTAENTHDVYATDVDGDGDVDIVAARFHGDSIRWWENDGAGTFTGHTIRDNFIRATSVYAIDMDGDGDVDILGTGEGANVIAWWENDPSHLNSPDDPITWTEHIIEGDIYGFSVYAIDMDGDGDTDVLGVDGGGHYIAWWENTTVPPNSPPEADPGGPYHGDEGSPITLDASGSYDPDGDLLEYSWDFNDDGIWEIEGSSTPTVDHLWYDDGIYRFRVGVSDGDLIDTDIADVTVNNMPPIVGDITAPADPVQVNTEISASADFTDAGLLDTHTAVWDWGDETTSEGVVDETEGSVSGTHTYATPGVYTVTLTVTDKDGASGESVFRFVAVYDPEGGFVTGGGWIDSPEGAYTADPSLTGKANFGFVSKYKRGASVPTGQTKFQFRVADLDFLSTSYDWLVVAGARAQFKGIGTINGAGDYGFMLTAVDAELTPSRDVDLFRIKIWDRATDEIVYDNQPGDYDGADLTTEIGGGNIVIHK